MKIPAPPQLSDAILFIYLVHVYAAHLPYEMTMGSLQVMKKGKTKLISNCTTIYQLANYLQVRGLSLYGKVVYWLENAEML